jgi:alcohol dehydrogenase
MRAVVFAGDGRVRVEAVADPRLEHPEDAIVRVHRSAVCGTDLHVVSHPEHLPLGFVLGHEFVGEVVEVGPAVRARAVGDRVVGADYTACGGCWWCRQGAHWHCGERRFFGTGSAFGPPLPGAQAELVRVPHADTVLVPLPRSVTDDAAVFLGDTLAAGYAAVRRGGLRPGQSVAVVGGGPVGQLTSLAAQACGAGPVVVVEPVADRRALADRNGALGVTPGEARHLLDDVTDGRGADLVVDAVGGQPGLDTGLELVRARGTVVSAGVHLESTWPLPVARAFTDELSLSFVIGDLMRDGDDLLALLSGGTLDPTVVASELVTLGDVPDAYARMAERLTLKALVAV